MMMLLMKLRTFALMFALMIAGAAAFTPAAIAGTDPIYTEFLSNKAAQGHDVVAYFKDGKATMGVDAYQTTYKGADFFFASQENLQDFKKDPDRYVPQYGGYCAWAIAQGKTAKGDAQFWEIVDGKLYLNYNEDVQKKWQSDISGFIQKADQIWPSILKD